MRWIHRVRLTPPPAGWGPAAGAGGFCVHRQRPALPGLGGRPPRTTPSAVTMAGVVLLPLLLLVDVVLVAVAALGDPVLAVAGGPLTLPASHSYVRRRRGPAGVASALGAARPQPPAPSPAAQHRPA
eukprot:EG_transcript_32850